MWACRWFRLDEQMQVIGHDFHDFDDHSYLVRLLTQQLLQTVCDMCLQYFTPVLRTPDQMIPDIIDAGI
jgi:hypothetical protein